jgi:two-component system, LytTR family, response regulator
MDVIIVDDEPAARRMLREYCACEPDLRIVGEYGDAKEALDAVRRDSPALLFLDIQMDTLNGVQLVRSLDPGALPIIVFVTAHDTYALEAFEVSATDYLLKPFDQDRFRRTLDRVRRRYQSESVADREAGLASVLARLERATVAVADTRPRLLAEFGSRMHMLDIARIELIEGDRNYVKLTIGRDVFHARSTLQQAQRTLESQPVLRISRSCLVNVNHVREVSRTPRGDFIFVLDGGATVTSSEGYRETVREYLARLKVSGAQ